MSTSVETFKVKSVRFTNYSDECKLFGSYHQGQLSYETELRINQSILNQLINQLQKINPDVEVSDLLESEPLIDGEFHYYLNASDLNNELYFMDIVEDRSFKQIRA
jgi:predicted Zn-dependent protease